MPTSQPDLRPDATERARRDPARADPGAGRRDGHPHPGPPARRAGVPRGALRRLDPRRQGQQRPAEPHPARDHRLDPPDLPRGRCRHRRDQHVHRDLDRAGGLRHAGPRLRDQPGGCPGGARGLRRGVHRRAAPLRGRLAGADQPHRVDLARRQRPRRPQRHLRRAGRGVPRAGPRPRRRRRRPAAGRDDLRHAQREGRDLRPGDPVRGARPPLAGDAVGHDHRRLGAHALRPGHRGVLALRAARPAPPGRPQLRAGRRRAAALRRRARAGSPTPSSPRTRTPGCRTPSASTTSPPSRWRPRVGEFAASGLVNVVGGCCGTTPEHIAAIGAAVVDATPRARRRAAPRAAPGRAGAADRHRGQPVRQRRRAHQHHRLGEVPQPDQGRRLRHRARGGRPAGRERRAGHRRQHGRGDDRRRRRHGPLPQAGRERARHQPGAGDGRLLEVGGHRGRAQVRAGQADRELDLHEGGRGGVRRARDAVPQVRRRRGRDGLRRGRPGRQPRASQGDLRAGLPDPGRPGRLPARGHHLRPQRLRGGDRHRGARVVRPGLHRGHPLDQGEPARGAGLRRHLQRRASRSGATTRCARRSTPSSSSTRSGPASTWASSTPARWCPTTRWTPSCASGSRTSCSTGARTPPSGCWRSPRSTTATAPRSRRPRRSGGRCRSASGSRTRWSRASTPTSRATPSCCAPRSRSAADARSR